jgi:hypothetical protein
VRLCCSSSSSSPHPSPIPSLAPLRGAARPVGNLSARRAEQFGLIRTLGAYRDRAPH